MCVVIIFSEKQKHIFPLSIRWFGDFVKTFFLLLNNCNDNLTTKSPPLTIANVFILLNRNNGCRVVFDHSPRQVPYTVHQWTISISRVSHFQANRNAFRVTRQLIVGLRVNPSTEMFIRAPALCSLLISRPRPAFSSIQRSSWSSWSSAHNIHHQR